MDERPAITVSDLAAGQLAYHLCRAVDLGTAGRHAEAVPETVVAWVLLRRAGGRACQEAMAQSDLPTPVAPVPWTQAAEGWRAAHELALELTAHFVSEQQHDLAALYQAAVGDLEDEIRERAPR